MAAVRLIDYYWPKSVLKTYLPLLSVLSSTNLEASTIYLKKKPIAGYLNKNLMQEVNVSLTIPHA